MPLRQLRCKAKKVKPELKMAGLFTVHDSESNIKNVSVTTDSPTQTRIRQNIATRRVQSGIQTTR
jgi:hypothetical protein